MTEIDKAIEAAFKSEGGESEANRAYALILSSQLFVPVDPKRKEFSPLFFLHDEAHYISAFDTKERLEKWAGNSRDKMNIMPITGRELIAGVKKNVHLCLNLGSDFFKPFSPDEIDYLKKVILKMDEMERKA